MPRRQRFPDSKKMEAPENLHTKYPNITRLHNLNYKKVVSFLFFSYLFMFSVSYFVGIIPVGYNGFYGQLYATCSVLFAMFGLHYSLHVYNPVFFMPLIIISMGAISSYLCVISMVVKQLLHPNMHFIGILFYIYLFLTIGLACLTIVQGIDVLWRSFFEMCALTSCADYNKYRVLMNGKKHISSVDDGVILNFTEIKDTFEGFVRKFK